MAWCACTCASQRGELQTPPARLSSLPRPSFGAAPVQAAVGRRVAHPEAAGCPCAPIASGAPRHSRTTCARALQLGRPQRAGLRARAAPAVTVGPLRPWSTPSSRCRRRCVAWQCCDANQLPCMTHALCAADAGWPERQGGCSCPCAGREVGQRHVWCGAAVASRYLTPFVALAS